MSDLPRLAPGHIRLQVRLSPHSQLTPGDIARACDLPAECVGAIVLGASVAFVDVVAARGRDARSALSRLGSIQLIDRNWVWLRLAVGRNHGIGMGQLRKILVNVEINPIGKIIIQNTHTLVGVADDQAERIVQRFGTNRINGYPPRPTILPAGMGPGSPAYTPGGR